jgi:hypothetical protein
MTAFKIRVDKEKMRAEIQDIEEEINNMENLTFGNMDLQNLE